MGDREFPTLAELQAEVSEHGLLNLFNRGLHALPHDVGRLVGVKTLNLYGNPIAARSLPASLWSLASLETLDLTNCALDRLPEEVGGLERLRLLCLSDNPNLHSLPWELLHCAHLQTLWRFKCPLGTLDSDHTLHDVFGQLREQQAMCALAAVQQRLAVAAALFASSSRLQGPRLVPQSLDAADGAWASVADRISPGLAQILSVVGATEDQHVLAMVVDGIPRMASLKVSQRAGQWAWRASQKAEHAARCGQRHRCVIN
eukprot:SAG31_NODE_9387_length_1286_cov_1.018534_1_plen_259_part_00